MSELLHYSTATHSGWRLLSVECFGFGGRRESVEGDGLLFFFCFFVELGYEVGRVHFDAAVLLLLLGAAPLSELSVLLFVLLMVGEAGVGCDAPFVLASLVLLAGLCGCDARDRAGRMHDGRSEG